MLTSLLSSGGDSLATSATKASRTVALPRILISVVEVSTLSRSAPQVGHVLASGRAVGGRSQTPLSTACRTRDFHSALLFIAFSTRSAESYRAALKDTRITRSHAGECSGSCSSTIFFFFPAAFLGAMALSLSPKLRSAALT